ncbi:glycosyltransferase [Pseudoduganella sp. LjRoot289]|uniref:glycosyltransferase n=1 Tax=Pseudoduganella sp. LjRoot289 TaxID=3342314 RepID=UPI003ED14FA9
MAITNKAAAVLAAAAAVASAATAPAAPAPLVLHLVDRLPEDGREDSLFKLLRQMPAGRYRHVVLTLNGAAECEVRHNGATVQVMSLSAGGGLGWTGCVRLYGLLRRLRPDLLHTRSVRAQLLAAVAGVRIRLPNAQPADALPARHALGRWLADALGAGPVLVHPAHGAIDSVQFHPRLGLAAAAVGPPGFLCENAFVIGAVGPMDRAQDHVSLVQAFLALLEELGRDATPLRLLIAGDGPCRDLCKAMLCAAGAGHLAWLPGARDDAARLMRSMDVFVAPSATPVYGDSLRVLEAMASGLPVVAAMAGAHPQLVQASWTGTLVPPGQPELLADAVADYYRIPGLARRHGQRARRLVLAHHSLATVADRYLTLYDTLLARQAR